MRCVRLACAIVVVGCVLSVRGAADAQEQVETSVASAPEPEVTSVPEEPLAAARFAPAFYNRLQQRLSEHHLEVPLQELPEERAAQPQAAPDPNTQTEVLQPGIAAAAATEPIRLLQNRGLSDSEVQDEASTVCEPTVATRGQEVLMTGNWFAAFSRDGGSTFQYVNPYTTFPSPEGRAFCCDQVALYDRQHDLMIWFLQYRKNSDGNTIRVAVAHEDDIRNQQWRYYDFTPGGVGGWDDEWFDYPELAVGEKFLYITTNSFTVAEPSRYRRAVVLRLPLEQLRQYQGFDYRYYSSDVGSLRPTQGAEKIMYIGGHFSRGAIRVLTWPEDSDQLTTQEVEVDMWQRGGASAEAPDGRDWLGFADGRITAAWMSGDEIGFGWTAAQDGNYSYPHVRIAIIDKDSKQLKSQPHVWNGSFAFAYPAAAPNDQGRVGVSLAYGGNTFYPSHAVGAYEPGSSSVWNLVTTASGNSGPSRNRWGDYLSVRPHGAEPQSWVATGFVLVGGPDNEDVQPRYVRFRRGGEAAPLAARTAVQPEADELNRAEHQQILRELRQIRELLKDRKQRVGEPDRE